MLNRQTEYKGCKISVSVHGPHAGRTYTGSFVITQFKGDADVDHLYTPAWGTPASSASATFDALTQVAKDVVDGKVDPTSASFRVGSG